jgi:hypothetical protein
MLVMWWDTLPPMIVHDYTDRRTLFTHCVCGHPKHYSQCTCGCTIFELDDGTDESPTHTGWCYGCSVFGYNGRYGGKYTI